MYFNVESMRVCYFNSYVGQVSYDCNFCNHVCDCAILCCGSFLIGVRSHVLLKTIIVELSYPSYNTECIFLINFLKCSY